jgi:hypothetical protein
LLSTDCFIVKLSLTALNVKNRVFGGDLFGVAGFNGIQLEIEINQPAGDIRVRFAAEGFCLFCGVIDARPAGGNAGLC